VQGAHPQQPELGGLWVCLGIWRLVAFGLHVRAKKMRTRNFMLFSQRKRTAKSEFNVDQKISYRAVLTRKKSGLSFHEKKTECYFLWPREKKKKKQVGSFKQQKNKT